MHRLLTKKNRDDDQPKTTNKLRSFKRNKSQPPPASRPQVDLTQALPPTDDFRISLMMPNLENRFSILRDGEKGPDGPGVNGIGYGALASGTLFSDGKDGDYVRPPYGGGLADITEVASIRSGSRAEGSFDLPERPSGEDYSGSVMNRPRQGDGNVLFGGRQKIYRINTAAMTSEEPAESPISPIGRGRMGGRALYTDDLPEVSAFRKKSPAEKESPRSQSPPPSNYNLDRNTQSSTNSGPTSLTRSSTAATSNSTNSRNFTPLVNPMISTSSSKPRKLIYEQALDRDMSEPNALESQRLAIMSQRRAGSTSPHPYSEENEKMRAMSPPPRSYAHPFAGREPEPRGRTGSPGPGLQASRSRDNFRQQVPGLRTTDVSQGSAPAKRSTPEPAKDVPFSFGFEERGQPKDAFPVSKTVANNHGLPTPRPESDEYQTLGVQNPASVAAAGPTPSPSPLTEKYPKPASISQSSESNLREEMQNRPASKQSSTSNSSSRVRQATHQATFFEASDSEHEMDDGASSVYEDDPDLPYEEPFVHDIPKSSPPRPLVLRRSIPEIQAEAHGSGVASSPTAAVNEASLHDSDSPTLPPNAGLSNMIRQHLRSDSGISSIYAPSTHRKMSEPYPDPPSLAQALANWDNQYPDYDEEAPFQPDNASEHSEPKPKYTLAELKKKEAEEKKSKQNQLQNGLPSGAPMERKISDNAISTGDEDDEHDEWRSQLEEKKRMLQQRLQEHSGRNSPVPGSDANDELPKNSILKPGMLGNMLKGKPPGGSPMGGRDESKAMKMLGISPMMNQSKESFKRREEEEEPYQEYPEEGMRPTQRRPDMDGRPRGPGPAYGQRMPQNPNQPYGYPPGRPYGPPGGPQGIPMNGPRSFLPMTGPPQGGPRRGANHIPIETGMPPATNMHREFIEQGRGGPRPGPGMPPHMQYRGPPPGPEQGSPGEFRPPHDRSYDSRGPPPQQGGGRSRARSNAQRPNDVMPRSPPQSKLPIRRGPASEEDLRGRQRGPPPSRMPGTNDMVNGVTTTVTTGTNPAPLNVERKPQNMMKPKSADPLRPKDAMPTASPMDSKTSDSPGRVPRPTNLNVPPPVEVSQSRFSTDDSPQASTFAGRFRSDSKSQKFSSIGIFEQNSASQTNLVSPQKVAPPISPMPPKPLAGSASGSPAKTLAELTGADNPNAAFPTNNTPALAGRELRKNKIKKADISEPTLMHTTSQMPVSNLIEAGGKVYPKILPPGLGDSPQLRQRSGSDESNTRIPRSAVIPPQNQRTSDPEGERARVLRKATSDGSGLRDRAMSSARSRPVIPDVRSPVYPSPNGHSPSPYFGPDGRPLKNDQPFYNNAPAGMI
ncbi:hypothetical protein ABW19_dt0207087 [Dactylella cylindrospora]|nr:hypothetical protein ABW19_dt0207087 [Dactylella cylindrospora]